MGFNPGSFLEQRDRPLRRERASGVWIGGKPDEARLCEGGRGHPVFAPVANQAGAWA